MNVLLVLDRYCLAGMTKLPDFDYYRPPLTCRSAWGTNSYFPVVPVEGSGRSPGLGLADKCCISKTQIDNICGSDQLWAIRGHDQGFQDSEICADCGPNKQPLTCAKHVVIGAQLWKTSATDWIEEMDAEVAPVDGGWYIPFWLKNYREEKRQEQIKESAAARAAVEAKNMEAFEESVANRCCVDLPLFEEICGGPAGEWAINGITAGYPDVELFPSGGVDGGPQTCSTFANEDRDDDLFEDLGNWEDVIAMGDVITIKDLYRAKCCVEFKQTAAVCGPGDWAMRGLSDGLTDAQVCSDCGPDGRQLTCANNADFGPEVWDAQTRMSAGKGVSNVVLTCKDMDFPLRGLGVSQSSSQWHWTCEMFGAFYGLTAGSCDIADVLASTNCNTACIDEPELIHYRCPQWCGVCASRETGAATNVALVEKDEVCEDSPYPLRGLGIRENSAHWYWDCELFAALYGVGDGSCDPGVVQSSANCNSMCQDNPGFVAERCPQTCGACGPGRRRKQENTVVCADMQFPLRGLGLPEGSAALQWTCDMYAMLYAVGDGSCDIEDIKKSLNCNSACQAEPESVRRRCPVTCGVCQKGKAVSAELVETARTAAVTPATVRAPTPSSSTGQQSPATPPPSPYSTDGTYLYERIASGGFCNGGQELNYFGPRWEMTAGMTACEFECNKDQRCKGYVWGEDFSCITYTACNGVDMSPDRVNYAYTRSNGSKLVHVCS